MDMKTVIVRVAFDSPLPDDFVQQGERSRKEIDENMSIVVSKSTGVVTVKRPDSIEDCLGRIVVAVDRLGIGHVSELHVTNTVSHYNSGIKNPEFSKATVFETKSDDKLRAKVDSAQALLSVETDRLAKLQATPPSKRHPQARRRQIERAKAHIKQTKARLQAAIATRAAKKNPLNTCKNIKLTHGKVMVMRSGTWIFTGQTSMDELHEALAEATALVTPMPDIGGLKL